MGRIKAGVHFVQSVSDFPLTVSLGGKSPAWGLNRWGACGLRFVPPDDEGFSLRGDNRRLVYKGRRRSHRFTILGNEAFEYDVILEREPESNVVSLHMEGAEKFDFFRQPDFLQEPLLAGSYAVYKKETLIGEGTGKLCHIHRPEIIDARGRRCWGDLSISGNELRITIPETFLSEAVYPVIVDPTIGTTTIGSQYLWDNNEPEEPLIPLQLEIQIGVNRFLVPETLNGTCTAFIYTNDDEPDAAGRPVLYSDNGNTPLTRKSKNENLIDFRVSGGKPKGWRNGTFQTNGSISSGSYIWFGVFAEYWLYPRFDYGAKFYCDWWDNYTSIPNTYPLYDARNYNNLKLSMYFTYSSASPAQNHVRTLTQGVRLADSRKLAGGYKRNITQTVKGITGLSRLALYTRHCLMTAYSSMALQALPTLVRKVLEQVRAGMGIFEGRELTRKLPENVQAGSAAYRSQGFCRKVWEGVRGTDYLSVPALLFCKLAERVRAWDTAGHWADYVRGLYFEAGNIAGTACGRTYYRTQTETVGARGSVFRGLLIFVRLLTTSLARDFVLRRFLKSNEEMVLKSGVCREMVIDSKV